MGEISNEIWVEELIMWYNDLNNKRKYMMGVDPCNDESSWDQHMLYKSIDFDRRRLLEKWDGVLYDQIGIYFNSHRIRDDWKYKLLK